MEQHLGRKLDRNEQVHHINGDCRDNRIENLQVLTNSEHQKLELSFFSSLLLKQNLKQQNFLKKKKKCLKLKNNELIFSILIPKNLLMRF